MRLQVITEEKFDKHFNNLRQVFLYITDECNLRCTQCYYKPWLKPGHPEIDIDVLLALIRKFREKGAIKLSILGGEPTLYGQHTKNKSLSYIVSQAREMGYQHIRVVSNGQFDGDLLNNEEMMLVDEITFSIDGDNPEIHDLLRGKDTFNKSVGNLKRAIGLNYKVQITTCVHRNNIGKDTSGRYLLERAIDWATSLGVNSINFHPIFKMNIPRDSWTGEVDISPKEWLAVYQEISQNVNNGKYRISVRIPQRFVPLSLFNSRSTYFGFCPVKLAERIEVHSNGQIHSCALNNGTPISIAKFSVKDNQLYINWSNENNELECYPFDFSGGHPCAVMKRNFGQLIPLCISFKPNQEEFIWKKFGLS
jgi:MoaA/NifB/PqqE/SkfB family radical SAM enzyme